MNTDKDVIKLLNICVHLRLSVDDLFFCLYARGQTLGLSPVVITSAKAHYRKLSFKKQRINQQQLPPQQPPGFTASILADKT